MRTKIMIIGGHGAVGQTISKAMSGENLVIAGRNKEKIDSFINKENIVAESRVINIHQFDKGQYEDVKTLIVCVDQDDTKLFEYCDENGIDYMDVSANSSYINKLYDLVLQNKSTLLLGVGIAPGVTNVLAKTIIEKNPQSKDIKIDVILGMGEKHGDAAIDWTLVNMFERYDHKDHGNLKPFKLKRNFVYNGKKYPTYNFNFADQFMVKHQYPDHRVTTYMGFDLPFVTRSINGLSTINALSVLKTKFGYNMAKKTLQNPMMGSDLFIVSASDDNQTVAISGHNEALFTGKVAALAAKKLVNETLPKGRISMAEIVDYETLLALNKE